MRPKVVLPSTPSRAGVIIERFFQSLLSFVIIGVIYRYCWIDASDPYKCSALLNRGSWLDPGRVWRSPDAFKNWQPPGCLMHEYKKTDIQECFKERRLVFIGDSTIRQIFWAVAKKLDELKAEAKFAEILEVSDKHTDLEFVISHGATLQFIWDPWLNSTGLDRELKKFRAEPSKDDVGGKEGSAGLVLLGAPGLWYARHGEENFFKDFRDSIDRVIPYMDHATNEKTALSKTPFPSRRQAPNFLLLAPIQVPRYQLLSPSREETMTPEKIDQMNDYLQQVSAHSKADVIWSYSLMTWLGRGQYEESGLHVVENVAHRKADVLLNLRCNVDAASKGFPFSRTCCSNYKQPSIAQRSILLAGVLALPTLLYMRRRHFMRVGRFLPAPQILNALTSFGLVVSFCYYADRTQAFEKAQRQFNRRDFLTGCIAVAVVGVVSTRKSKIPSKTIHKNHEDKFLSRDQTEEWKGWMQAILLIYHYTHGSKTLWIYEIVRLLVASYLFMTGFGHTLYFLKTDDYSLKRVAHVLIRLNLLNCILPYMMRTEYLFYYFAPLVSFWFLVIYTTLKVKRQGNKSFNFIVAKVVVSAAFTSVFTKMPGILETVSIILKYTCAMSINVTEWRFRTSLDMYIVYVGMVMAVLYQRFTQPAAPGQWIDNFIRLAKVYSEIFVFVTFFSSLFLLPAFWALIRRSPNKEDYNWWQPYVSIVPILSFVTLRNSHILLRNYHSLALAWLGRCSLETYILQYHIWLAGDAKGLLRTGLWENWTEAAILTPVFLWIAWCTANATRVLTAWIVNGNSPPSPNRGKFQDEAKNSPYLLPTTFDEEGTPSKDLRFDFGKGKKGRWLGGMVASLTDSLKRRLMCIGMILWIANITYR